MNSWVKSFIVINLILSALYAAFTMLLFTNRQDWKDKYHQSQKNYEDQKQKIQELDAELEQMITKRKSEVSSLEQKLVGLEDKKNDYAQQLKEKESEITRLKYKIDESESDNKELLGNFNKIREDLKESQTQLNKAREVAQASRTIMMDLREQIVNFEIERNRLSSQLLGVRKEKSKLEDELKSRDWQIAKLQKSGIDVAAIVASAGEPDIPIHAKVLAVRKDVNIALISAGDKDKVKEGYKFTIYRGGSYIGKVQIESVYPSYASARILTDLLAKDKLIKEGDNASTRVY